MKIIKSHKELIVYQSAFKTSMEIFLVTKSFPKEEVYSLTSQVRRSSRSVSTNIAEAFRKRRYKKAFLRIFQESEKIIGMLVVMITHPEKGSLNN